MNSEDYIWFLYDGEGRLHARIGQCDKVTAVAIARGVFPEIDRVRIRHWRDLPEAERARTDCPFFTRGQAMRLGIALPGPSRHEAREKVPAAVAAAQLRERWQGRSTR